MDPGRETRAASSHNAVQQVSVMFGFQVTVASVTQLPRHCSNPKEAKGDFLSMISILQVRRSCLSSFPVVAVPVLFLHGRQNWCSVLLQNWPFPPVKSQYLNSRTLQLGPRPFHFSAQTLTLRSAALEGGFGMQIRVCHRFLRMIPLAFRTPFPSQRWQVCATRWCRLHSQERGARRPCVRKLRSLRGSPGRVSR